MLGLPEHSGPSADACPARQKLVSTRMPPRQNRHCRADFGIAQDDQHVRRKRPNIGGSRGPSRAEQPKSPIPEHVKVSQHACQKGGARIRLRPSRGDPSGSYSHNLERIPRPRREPTCRAESHPSIYVDRTFRLNRAGNPSSLHTLLPRPIPSNGSGDLASVL